MKKSPKAVSSCNQPMTQISISKVPVMAENPQGMLNSADSMMSQVTLISNSMRSAYRIKICFFTFFVILKALLDNYLSKYRSCTPHLIIFIQKVK